MTTLNDRLIGEVCRKAGFTGVRLPEAIALAIAASGGIPAYDHPIWPGPVAHYRGLWGLDIIRWADYAEADLSNPYTAAQVAYAMTEACDGFWWCPAYRASTHPAYFDRARAAAHMLPGREPVIEPTMIATHRTRTLHTLNGLTDLANAIGHTRHPKGP